VRIPRSAPRRPSRRPLVPDAAHDAHRAEWTLRRSDDGYCPSGLDPDPGASGLVAGATVTALGTVRHQHAPRRSTETATVLLHGAAGSWTTWTPALRAAREAGAPLEDVVAVDLPGWGASVLAVPDGEVTLDAMVDAVLRVVDDLGYDGCRIVGHSMGGFIALHAAARHPDRVRSLALVSPTLRSVIRCAAHPIRRVAVLPGFTMMLGAIRTTRLLGPAGPALVRLLARVGILRPLTRPLFAHVRRVPGSVIRALAAEVRPRGFLRATGIAATYSADAMWPRTTCPVAAVRGGRDVFVTAEDLRELARDVPGARVTVIAGAGHFGHVERPAETLRALGLIPVR
jgi:pimeloyl-ACP methyl ester carboxylesterase